MKKTLVILLCLVTLLGVIAGCGQQPTNEGSTTPAGDVAAPEKDVKMQYISAADAADVLGTDGYTFLDVRKAEDYAASHIPGAISTDMDAAKEGDFNAGVATMQTATKDLTDTLVIICYSGKAYAQATTNVLSAIGYDMSKVYTLEGGFNGWSETYPDKVEATGAENTAPEESAPPEEEPAEEIETVSGTVTTSIDMTQYEQGKVVRVWLPVAQTDDYQTVGNVEFDAGSAKAELTEDALGNQMLYIEWDADADPASRTASVSFHASRPEVLRPELVEEGAPGSELDEYLQPSSTIPLDGEVKTLADEITKDQTTCLGKARAIYDWIIANMERDNSVIGCGQGNVPELLNTLRGKCTDINSVFVGLCRASGIPARETFGIRMNADDITGNQHCWAQFYLPGTGWVFADPADVLKAVLTNEWDKEDAETKELQEYYWGGVDAKRVGLSSGRDIVLSPAQEGAALNNFGYPYAEVDGQVMDCYEPADFVYSIAFAAD